MRYLLLCLLLVPCSELSAYQKREYKDFFRSGKKMLAEGNPQGALQEFVEAFRLEPEAQVFREEGVHFTAYLPRYYLALANESQDLAKAEDWAKKSKEALEEKIIKDKKETQKYFADLKRITEAAQVQREKLAASFKVALQDAETLLSQRKFEKAKTQFQELAKNYPDKPEALAGIARVENEKKYFLKELELDFSTAVQNKKFADATGILAQIRQVDSGNINLPRFEQQLNAAKTEQEKATSVASAPKQEPIRTTAAPAQQPTRPTQPAPQPSVQQASVSPQAVASKPNASSRQALRTALLDSLKPYRRGDPASALSKLNAISLPGKEDSASYQWLRGVYLLTDWKTANEPKPAQKDEAQKAIAKALELMPNFKPDEKLYPAFILETVSKLSKTTP